MIRIWRGDEEVHPGIGVEADHPLVRWGEGLFETMRASGGGIPLAERHLARLTSSLAALAIPDPPWAADLSRALEHLGAAGEGSDGRVRLTAAAGRLVIVERTAAAPLSAEPRSALGALMPGEWAPGRRTGEHKTVSYLGYRDAARRAAVADADIALLTDSHGRLGEADRGNLIAVIDGEVRTPPVRGILPGIARAWALERNGPVEAPIKAADREVASEIVMCNAVEGFVAVTAVDGVPVGDGTPGPYARGAQERFASMFT